MEGRFEKEKENKSPQFKNFKVEKKNLLMKEKKNKIKKKFKKCSHQK